MGFRCLHLKTNEHLKCARARPEMAWEKSDFNGYTRESSAARAQEQDMHSKTAVIAQCQNNTMFLFSSLHRFVEVCVCAQKRAIHSVAIIPFRSHLFARIIYGYLYLILLIVFGSFFNSARCITQCDGDAMPFVGK